MPNLSIHFLWQALILHSGVDRFLRLERGNSAKLKKELREQRAAAEAATNSQKELEGRLKTSGEEKEALQRKYAGLEKRMAATSKDAEARVKGLELSLKEKEEQATSREKVIAQQQSDLRVAAEFGFEECKRAVNILLAPSIPGGLPDSFSSWNLDMAPLRHARGRSSRGETPGSSSHGASGV